MRLRILAITAPLILTLLLLTLPLTAGADDKLIIFSVEEKCKIIGCIEEGTHIDKEKCECVKDESDKPKESTIVNKGIIYKYDKEGKLVNDWGLGCSNKLEDKPKSKINIESCKKFNNASLECHKIYKDCQDIDSKRSFYCTIAQIELLEEIKEKMK